MCMMGFLLHLTISHGVTCLKYAIVWEVQGGHGYFPTLQKLPSYASPELQNTSTIGQILVG